MVRSINPGKLKKLKRLQSDRVEYDKADCKINKADNSHSLPCMTQTTVLDYNVHLYQQSDKS